MPESDKDINCRLYTIWPSDDMMRDIKHIAVNDGVSVAMIVRQLIADYVQARKMGCT